MEVITKEETTETQKTEEEVVDTSKKFEQLKEEVTTQVSNISKVLDKFGSEMGEDRKQRDTLSSEIGSIKELLQERAAQTEESDFDPYQKEQVLGLVDERIKPLSEKEYLTKEAFREELTNMLSTASQNAKVQDEFKLSPEELNEIVNKSTETGLSVRELAFDEYGERKFKNKEFAEKLSEELKNNDTTPPLETATETIFDKTGIPADPDEFQRWYAEQEKIAPGTAKQKMMEAERKAVE